MGFKNLINTIRWKRKMKTPLGNNNIELGEYIEGYHNCSPLMICGQDVLYIAEDRMVRFRVVIPNGPQGYTMLDVPMNIKTVGDLLDYLSDAGECTLKSQQHRK